MFALPSFQLSSACTIEKESEVHVMWATQDKLSNDVADYFILFFPPSSRVLSPPPPPKWILSNKRKQTTHPIA
jgi:hypothetical protein